MNTVRVVQLSVVVALVLLAVGACNAFSVKGLAEEVEDFFKPEEHKNVPEKKPQPESKPEVDHNEHVKAPTKVPVTHPAHAEASDKLPLYSEDMISHIKNSQSTWIPDENSPFKDYTIEDMKRLTNQWRMHINANGKRLNDGPRHKLPVKKIEGDRASVPISFDSREHWYDCQTVPDIRDQGNCGSCWAFGSTSAIQDRYCIATGNQDFFSARDLMSCCPYCGSGCEGGEAQDAYHYLVNTGIVTGGNWKSQLGCQAYPIPINLNHGTVHQKTPQCLNTCTEKKYAKSYPDDKIKASSAWIYDSSDQKGIMLEIMRRGPISAGYDVYSDFPLYKDGVYSRTSDKKVGGHEITIIGWGVEKGTPYWLCKNSWNKLWGHHGFFKIRRTADSFGKNSECGIEDELVGADFD
eukprot:Nk52_evm30s266 gene=Nk52_evmTU30s266